MTAHITQTALVINSTSSASDYQNAKNAQNNCSEWNKFIIEIDISSGSLSCDKSRVSKQRNYWITQIVYKRKSGFSWWFFLTDFPSDVIAKTHIFFLTSGIPVNIANCLACIVLRSDFFTLSNFPFVSAYSLDCFCFYSKLYDWWCLLSLTGKFTYSYNGFSRIKVGNLVRDFSARCSKGINLATTAWLPLVNPSFQSPDRR